MATSRPRHGALTVEHGSLFGEMTSSKLALEELQKIVELFSSNQLPEVCAKALIDSPMKPCSKWSLGNQLLMLIHVTADARGFRQWQEVKRHVSKGARAFYILGPIIVKKMVKVKDEQTGEETGEEQEGEFLIGFKAIPVFRYEETDGEPLPEYKPRDLPPLVDVAQKWNIKIAYEIVPREYGSFSPSLSLIQLGTESWDTFFHELVHAAEQRLGQLNNHQENETVAQLAAATLCRMYGRDSDAYSWNYIAKYAGEKSPETVGRLCTRVLGRVQKVITTILETQPSSGIWNLN